MKKYEKEALFKTFGIFFLSLAFLTTLLAYAYDKEQKHILDEQILARMKAFTYDFKTHGLEVDVVAYVPGIDELNIQVCDEGMCGYFRIESAPQNMFKVILHQEEYDTKRGEIFSKVLMLYSVVLVFIAFFALFYSFYALKPLKQALHVMEEFLKDVVHDFNTPLTSILLNVKMLSKRHPTPELERIELGAKSIASLYHNLEVLHRGFVPHKSRLEIEAFLHVKTKTFQKLYPQLHFSFHTQPYTLYTDEEALGRIIDNILSNACKYNQKHGSIILSNEKNRICIQDTGKGIKRCDAVFERYYKESERGLGLGLHIVKTLCDALGITIVLESEEGVGTRVWLECPKEEHHEAF